MAADQLRQSIMSHEGTNCDTSGNHVAYRDHLGHLTIGYGTLLDERLEISEEIAAELLSAEIKEKEERLLYVDGWAQAGPVRRAVLLEMAYWMGVGGCLRFRRMWDAVRKKEWLTAAAEMRDSRTFRDPQTRGRMETLAGRMESEAGREGRTMRRAARTDVNQGEIVEALRKVGATVTPTHMVGGGYPDISVGYHGRTVLFEIKNGERWKLTSDEFDWHERWAGEAYIVTTPEEAIDRLTAGGVG